MCREHGVLIKDIMGTSTVAYGRAAVAKRRRRANGDGDGEDEEVEPS